MIISMNLKKIEQTVFTLGSYRQSSDSFEQHGGCCLKFQRVRLGLLSNKQIGYQTNSLRPSSDEKKFVKRACLPMTAFEWQLVYLLSASGRSFPLE